MASQIDGVKVLSEPSYTMCVSLIEMFSEQMKLIIPSINPYVFDIIVFKQNDSVIGEFILITVLQKETRSNYKVNISVGECIETVTNLHPTTKPIKRPNRYQPTMTCKFKFEHVMTTPEVRLLFDDLKIFLDGQPSVILRGSDTEISVAKELLEMRSSVLKAMFSHDMKETNTSIIDLPDFKSITLQAFCNFLLTDEVIPNNETALELYNLADKYDIQGLKNISTQYICNNWNNLEKDDKFFSILIKTNEQLFKQLFDEKYSDK